MVSQSLAEQQRLLVKSRSYKDNYTDEVKCAIYGRVSTKHDAQLNAFDNQMDWYKMLLKQHPKWKVVEVYSDQATGTNTKSRKDFNRMIEDAMKGKFQLLITREVCRFARNTVDSLSYVRSLNLYDVEVFFVNDNIWSRDPDGELRLTIFAALAQDEARKTSERCRAGQLISREKGILYGYNAFGYTHVKGETSAETRYIINEEEADTVRLIFDLYLSGKGMKAITTQLIAEGRKNKSGIVKWDCTTVSRILSQKLYCGYITYGKSHKENFLSKRIVNRDKSSYIYVKSDNVEPIISEEDYDKVQEIKQQRKKGGQSKAQCKLEAKERYIRKLVCGECGKTFKKMEWHKNQDGVSVFGYQCRNIIVNHKAKLRTDNGQSGEGYCNLPAIAQWKLDFMLTSIVNDLWDEPKKTVRKLLSVVSDACSDTTENDKYAKRIGVLNTEIAKAQARKESLEMKWLDNKLSDSDHDRLCGVIDNNIAIYKAEIQSLTNLLEDVPDESERETKLANIRKLESVLLSNNNLTTLQLDDEFVDAFVARIVPYEGRRFKWYLNIGTGKGWTFFSEDAYELYDNWTLGFESARRFRKANNQYLRKNQWEDIHIEVYIRMK